MMMKPVLAVAAMIVLAGCATGLSPEKYAAGQQLLRGSPALKRDYIERCVKKTERKYPTPASRKDLADLGNVSTQQMPRAFCRRLFNGYVENRITYADYRAALNGKVLNPKVIKLFQGL